MPEVNFTSPGLAEWLASRVGQVVELQAAGTGPFRKFAVARDPATGDITLTDVTDD